LSAAGPDFVASHFGLARMIDATEALYRDAWSTRPGA